jgi:hypothetical protein
LLNGSVSVGANSPDLSGFTNERVIVVRGLKQHGRDSFPVHALEEKSKRISLSGGADEALDSSHTASECPRIETTLNELPQFFPFVRRVIDDVPNRSLSLAVWP